MQSDIQRHNVIRMYVDGVGLRGPGMNGWTAGGDVLAGRVAYIPSATVVPECELLPAAERRRAVRSIKLALAVANEAAAASDNRSQLATVFTSSAGDSQTLHEIMQILAVSPRQISPTRFHNSVHNAPAGYWHIASGCREASTTISCYDASFAAGFLEAGAQIAAHGQPVLLVAYDLPHPAPLDAVRTIGCSFGAAFYLSPLPTAHSLARVEINLMRDTPFAKSMQNPDLETLRTGNPAARSLPILELLARGASGMVYVDYVAGNTLAVSVHPVGAAGELRKPAVE